MWLIDCLADRHVGVVGSGSHPGPTRPPTLSPPAALCLVTHPG
jgi:hypothetical protein